MNENRDKQTKKTNKDTGKQTNEQSMEQTETHKWINGTNQQP